MSNPAAPPFAKTADPVLPPPDRTALFLDFDGTLVDIVETPDGVTVPAHVHDVLAALAAATGGATAIISGRTVSDVRKFLHGFDGTIVGSHGAEWFADGELESHPLAGSDAVAEATARAHAFAEGDDRLLVEEKPAGVVLHYRRAPEREDEVRAAVKTIARGIEGLVPSPAKMACELRPADVSKRGAVARLAGDAPFAGRTPAYFGDDHTDEAAMEWVLEQGGTAVKIGEGKSCAPHRLATPADVVALLADWTGGK
ncbi:trehalose 6-phosphatase [Tranquillimonas alkanivorans]|uniref:Trehalose 6-phosphate phosphatase n=1 Tax=Tranquillimonas alkanivorans TaxID=441119 RepID=A0A1I5S2D2_9RHOB|nr:trehalose 6-phosphatase [Tranquillimonas alkanivorans]